MKKIVVVLVSFVVAVLIGVGYVFTQDKISKASIPEPSLGPEWKLVVKDFAGSTIYLNTRSITHLPKGIVEVRTLVVPRGEARRKAVNDLKKYFLSKGKDPNNAKRLWYSIELEKVNCEKHQNAILELDTYSFEKTFLFSYSLQHEKWNDIDPGSAEEGIEKYVCKSEALIPEPSLSSRWKLVARGSGRSTIYVDTRRITFLPKGIVEVWTLVVPRGEYRRALVNALKHTLTSEGDDPNDAESLWYFIKLEKVDCKNYQSAIPEFDIYSFGEVPLYSRSYQHEEWNRIIPGDVGEDIEEYVCKKHK